MVAKAASVEKVDVASREWEVTIHTMINVVVLTFLAQAARAVTGARGAPERVVPAAMAVRRSASP
jgi:hypothetical protein